jgi:hypothetical protein
MPVGWAFDPAADSADRYADQYAPVKKTTVVCDWSSVCFAANLPFPRFPVKSQLYLMSTEE